MSAGNNPGAAAGSSGGSGGGAAAGAAGAAGGVISGLLDVGGLGAALDSSLADAYELNQRFPPADVSKVVQAQAANKALSEDLKLVLKDLAGFITRPTQSLATIKRHAPKFVIGGTILALMAKSDSAVIATFPKPVSIVVGPSNSTTKKPVSEYFMVTVENTPVEAFQKYIVTLPDRGAGRQKHYDWPRKYQTYVGNMTQEEALAVNENSKLNGFDLQHEQLERGPELRPAIYVSPEYPNTPLSDTTGHGDKVAAMALGSLFGVANQASLVAVKQTNTNGVESAEGAYDNWKWMISDVRRKSGEGKSVINWSGSTDYQRWGLVEPEHPDFFLPLLADCWAADIVTVFALGNKNDPEEEDLLGAISPQRHANRNNPIILVGSVNADGVPDGYNKDIGPASDARGRDLQFVGENIIYALGDDVDVIVSGAEQGSEKVDGTSFAAPQIAGLAAYFLTLPGSVWSPGHVAQSIKDHIVAKKRKAPGSPDGFNVAYNAIEEILRCPPGSSGSKKSRRRFIDYTAVADYFTNVYRRQKRSKSEETTIFKDGRLTDQKYSNKKISSSTSASSKPTAKPSPPPAPPPAPPKETTYPAPAKESDCYAKDKDKTRAEDFKLTDSETYIEVACKTQEKYPFEVFSIIDEANRLLKLKVGDGDEKKKKKPFSKDACISSFSRAVRQCPTEENDRTYGGHVRISTTPFVVTAGRMEFKTKDIKCSTNDDKTSPDWLKPRYDRDEARKVINEVCIGTSNWEVKHTEIAPWDHVTPLYTFTVELKNGKTYLGFDKALCKKVFEGIVDKCAEKRKGEPWGGRVSVEDINFDFFVGKEDEKED
ncbi:MAG: hypothetical protein Q9198_003024 [Flavoplaca austrocitrina]